MPVLMCVLFLLLFRLCDFLQTGTVGDVKAAALDISGPNTCVAVFVGGGSSIETAENAGASKVLEYMAFQATKARCGKDQSMFLWQQKCTRVAEERVWSGREPEMLSPGHGPAVVGLGGSHVEMPEC